MKHSGDFHHDLRVSELSESKLNDIFSNKKIEVKRDFYARKTGNVFIEYSCKGYKSGISTTNADYYCIFLDDDIMIMIETNKLKSLCRKYFKTNRDVRGGDYNTAKGILLPLKDIISKKASNAKYTRGT